MGPWKEQETGTTMCTQTDFKKKPTELFGKKLIIEIKTSMTGHQAN